MPFTLTMPKMSPTMEEGTIAKWHKKEGDKVEANDLLLEVATDKATVEYNALDSGWLKKILVPEGDEAIVNQPIAVFTEEKEESIEGYKPEGEPSKQAQQPAAASTAPAVPPSPTVAKPAPSAEAISAPKPQAQPIFHEKAETDERRILASPLARRLAKDKGLDLSGVKGSGPNGRIMSRDLEKAQPMGKAAFGRKELPKEKAGAFEEERLTPMRKVIAQRLVEAKVTIPHFYVQTTIDAQPLVELREQLLNYDLKVSINDCIIKACALALQKHPVVNSGFNAANNSIIRFKTIDVAVAVSVAGGLITPIVRYADYKSLSEISQEIRDLAKKAKEGKLEENEYKGGSFTVSNLGMFGVTEFQAIINPPQAAILAVAGILDVPVVKGEVVVPGKRMNLTLSADHRVVDGVAGAEFLKTLKLYLENPSIILIQ